MRASIEVRGATAFTEFARYRTAVRTSTRHDRGRINALNGHNALGRGITAIHWIVDPYSPVGAAVGGRIASVADGYGLPAAKQTEGY